MRVVRFHSVSFKNQLKSVGTAPVWIAAAVVVNVFSFVSRVQACALAS